MTPSSRTAPSRSRSCGSRCGTTSRAWRGRRKRSGYSPRRRAAPRRALPCPAGPPGALEGPLQEHADHVGVIVLQRVPQEERRRGARRREDEGNVLVPVVVHVVLLPLPLHADRRSGVEAIPCLSPDALTAV